MNNLNVKIVLLPLLLGLLYSSTATAGIAEAFGNVVKFIRGDLLENIALLAILGVIIVAIVTQTVHWTKLGIQIGSIGAAYWVLDLFKMFKGL